MACGFIAIATMYQIRTSLQVILKRSNEEQVEKKQRCFNIFIVCYIVLN